MDISYQAIELACPNCHYTVEVLLKQVMAEEKTLCPGCYAEIQLVDEGGSARQAQAEIDQALADLERQLRRFGR
jgi:Zn finger protein HypA/HybF involved in hydrogenase expression